MALRSINPATNVIIKEYSEMPIDDARDIIEKSHIAFLSNAPIDLLKSSFSI